mmetsp:Transcript_10205/g.24529  ORF Transcript_10205/g.24529 Transcript_10205/m.24529 type:complete len:98 (+) Transcript_10205:849-1142(+)
MVILCEDSFYLLLPFFCHQLVQYRVGCSGFCLTPTYRFAFCSLILLSSASKSCRLKIRTITEEFEVLTPTKLQSGLKQYLLSAGSLSLSLSLSLSQE